jgi:hypothetical protein
MATLVPVVRVIQAVIFQRLALVLIFERRHSALLFFFFFVSYSSILANTVNLRDSHTFVSCLREREMSIHSRGILKKTRESSLISASQTMRFIPHQLFTFEAIVKVHQLRASQSSRPLLISHLSIQLRETIDLITSYFPLSPQAAYYTSLYSCCRQLTGSLVNLSSLPWATTMAIVLGDSDSKGSCAYLRLVTSSSLASDTVRNKVQKQGMVVI